MIENRTFYTVEFVLCNFVWFAFEKNFEIHFLLALQQRKAISYTNVIAS